MTCEFKEGLEESIEFFSSSGVKCFLRSRSADISHVPGLDMIPLSLVEGGSESDMHLDHDGSIQQSLASGSWSKSSSKLAESKVFEPKSCLD